MATKIYADIRTALAHSRRVAHAPLRWDPVGHLLSRFGFGPTPRTRAAVTKNGLQSWVDNQIELGVRQGGYRAHKGVQAVGRQLTLSPYDAQQWLGAQGNQYGWTIMDQLTQVTLGLQAWSPAQLYESLVDFFSNHLNVPNHAGDMWVTRAPYDREVIRPWVMHDFTNMLLASARHPAMLTFLNLAESTKAAVNENYGRELLELHTVGLRYSERDVRNAAALLTGRTVDQYQHYVYDDYIHPTGPINVLDFTNANTDATKGEAAGDALLRYLANHPYTAIHLAQKMCVRFVSDNPSTTLVNAVASGLSRQRHEDHADGQDHPVLERVLGEPRREGTASCRERRRIDPCVRRAGRRLRKGDPGSALDHRIDEQRATRLAGAERVPGRRGGLAIGRKPAHRVGHPPRPGRRLVAGIHPARDQQALRKGSHQRRRSRPADEGADRDDLLGGHISPRCRPFSASPPRRRRRTRHCAGCPDRLPP